LLSHSSWLKKTADISAQALGNFYQALVQGKFKLMILEDEKEYLAGYIAVVQLGSASHEASLE